MHPHKHVCPHCVQTTKLCCEMFVWRLTRCQVACDSGVTNSEQRRWTSMNSRPAGLKCCCEVQQQQQLEAGVSEVNFLTCSWMLARRVLCIRAPETCSYTKPGSSPTLCVYMCMPHVCISKLPDNTTPASNYLKQHMQLSLTNIHHYKYWWVAWHPGTL